MAPIIRIKALNWEKYLTDWFENQSDGIHSTQISCYLYRNSYRRYFHDSK